jgi:hypothetical protein
MMGTCGLLLIVYHLCVVLVLVLWVGVEGKKKLRCEEYFYRLTY